MKPAINKLTLVLLGALLFNFIFWQEKIAVNAILFDAFILVALFYLYPPSFHKIEVKLLLLANLISLANIIIQNSNLSKLSFSISLLLLVVFSQNLHRSVWYAAATAITNYLMLVFSFFESGKQIKSSSVQLIGFRKVIRYSIIPILITTIFFILYSFSNSVFNVFINKISVSLQHFFETFFNWFSWQRFWFLALGLILTGGLLLKANHNYFSKIEQNKKNELIRNKHNLVQWKKSAMYDLLCLFMGKLASSILALKNENNVGIISLTLLNVLLLLINVIDIVYVWFGFTYTPDKNLTASVHEGASLLIFSILLAMLVLLFFFRGNLNFYKKNRSLKYGAYLWIIQNCILVLSVFLKDYYYIIHQGLAYKRIGVLVFLAMVLMGLISVFIKIKNRKTVYYLLRINGWFAIVLLVISSCIHWDETIASYNLLHKNSIPIDVDFLVSLSDKTLPLLQKNQDVLFSKNINENRPTINYKQIFVNRKNAFFDEQKHYSWLSFNFADAYVKKELTKNIIIHR